MPILFASSSSPLPRLELQQEVVGAVGGGGGGHDDVSARIRATIVRGELSAAEVRTDLPAGYTPSKAPPPTLAHHSFFERKPTAFWGWA